MSGNAVLISKNNKNKPEYTGVIQMDTMATDSLKKGLQFFSLV